MATTEVKKPDWIKNLGHANEMPTPFKEVAPSEFWGQFSTYGFGNRTEYRQVPLKLKDGQGAVHHGIHIIWYHNVAYAIATFVKKNPNWQAMDAYDATFYRIGCQHDYHELSASEARQRGVHHFGNCYHVYRCSLCGHIESVDSSG